MSFFSRLRYELLAFGSYLRELSTSVLGAAAAVLSFWALAAYASQWLPGANGALVGAPPPWVFWPVFIAALVVTPYQLVRLWFLGEPIIPDFLILREGPRLYRSETADPPRKTRYLFQVPAMADWVGAKVLSFHCTGEIADPAVWVHRKPPHPGQFQAETTSFRVDFGPDADKLQDGVEIFVLYYSWEAGVRIYKVTQEPPVPHQDGENGEEGGEDEGGSPRAGRVEGLSLVALVDSRSSWNDASVWSM